MSEQTKSNRPEILRNRRQAGRQAQMSFPTKPFPHGIQFIFHDYDYSKFVSSIKVNNTDGKTSITSNPLGLTEELTGAEEVATNSIELPFPRTLTDSQNIRVNTFERGFFAERAASLVSQTGSNFGDAYNSIMSGAKTLLGKVRESGTAIAQDPSSILSMVGDAFPNIDRGQAQTLATFLARDLIGSGLSQTLGGAAGLAVNPQDTLSFTGVDLKTFNFSWDLYPSNKDDSEQLKKIINFIKRKTLPETISVAGSQSLNRAFLKYPSVVEINLLGVNEAHFMRFKRAMISNVTVDYGTGGMVTIMKGGVPSAVTLTLSFQELNIHTAEDYDVPPGDNASVGKTQTD